MIKEIDDDLVGRVVWYFDPRKGVSHVRVTSIEGFVGRHRKQRWGLWYDVEINGHVRSRILWVKDYPLFESRVKCENYVKAQLKRSAADAVLDMSLGLEEKLC